jgi:lysophospholipase L1-like esterase
MDMVARFSKDVLAKKPKVVVITAGTNDLAENDGFHVSIDDIMNNIRLMATAAEDYGAKIIIGSVCPSRDFSWKRSDSKYATDYSGDGIANKIIALNAMLKAWAESEGYGYADYHSALKDSQNNLKDEYCYVKNGELDRVHPGAAGFAVMEQVLKPLIDAALGK